VAQNLLNVDKPSLVQFILDTVLPEQYRQVYQYLVAVREDTNTCAITHLLIVTWPSTNQSL